MDNTKVQDAASYQQLLDLAARADVHEGIRQGLQDVALGHTRPAQDVFNQIRERCAYSVEVTDPPKTGGSLLLRVEHRHPRLIEVAPVACDDRKAVM